MNQSRNALLSVYNKTGIVEFAGALLSHGFRLYSSGNTAKAIASAGLEVTDVAELVGGGAILGHRVVTLSREVHAGLLARYPDEDPENHDAEEMAELGIPYIDLACVDLYPLADEIAKADSTPKSVLEQTDIGGPTMLRSAAKGRRIVIGRVQERQRVLDWLEAGEPDSEAFRIELAGIAEGVVANYALQSARYTSGGTIDGMVGEQVELLKYGENNWQNDPERPAALFKLMDNDDPLAVHAFDLVEGDLRSLVNLTDVDSELQLQTHIAAGFAENFDELPYIAVAVKHGNACGAAVGYDPVDVVRKMVAGDKRAIFGGVVMTNFPITREVAEALVRREEGEQKALFDGVFAPAFSDDAPAVLKRFQGKCRMMTNSALTDLGVESLDTAPRFRPVRGGFLRQPNYTFVLDVSESHVYGGEVTESGWRDVVLGWAVGSVSNSNTTTLISDGQLLGNGVGQQDRVGSCELAVKRAEDAGHSLAGCVGWTDSFFPFADALEVLDRADVAVVFASSNPREASNAPIVEAIDGLGVVLAMQPDAKVRGFAKH